MQLLKHTNDIFIQFSVQFCFKWKTVKKNSKFKNLIMKIFPETKQQWEQFIFKTMQKIEKERKKA